MSFLDLVKNRSIEYRNVRKHYEPYLKSKHYKIALVF